ncbi:hypothetical protein [Clostridium sp.]|jgi:hypothetical protein|uniref:hypothetical protein n=1 Tax=Clostridium sp. TaxID=1506 RepID=UPI0039F5C7C8
MDGTNFVSHLSDYIGETVTIFTTSGGESGEGFTGVLLGVNNSFVRLITQIGIAPGCPLGSCCNDRKRCRNSNGPVAGAGFDGYNNAVQDNFDNDFNSQCLGQEDLEDTGRFTCRGTTVGSVTDIPIDRIAAFVHNAV